MFDVLQGKNFPRLTLNFRNGRAVLPRRRRLIRVLHFDVGCLLATRPELKTTKHTKDTKRTTDKHGLDTGASE
jgi:hypothetical protein